MRSLAHADRQTHTHTHTYTHTYTHKHANAATKKPTLPAQPNVTLQHVFIHALGVLRSPLQVLQPGGEMRVFVDVTVGARLWHEHGLTHRHGGVDEDNVPLVTKDMQPLEVTVSSLTFPGEHCLSICYMCLTRASTRTRTRTHIRTHVHTRCRAKTRQALTYTHRERERARLCICVWCACVYARARERDRQTELHPLTSHPLPSTSQVPQKCFALLVCAADERT